MHNLIVGVTESGKSCLAKSLARGLHKQGKKVAVLDPLGDRWEGDLVTSDIAEFDKYLRDNRSVFLFVDESFEVFNSGRDLTYRWWATTSRHYGHSATFISQRAMDVPRSMRDQCGVLYLFTSAAEDGKILAGEYNKPEIEACNQLPQMYFYRTTRFGKLGHFRIKDFREVVPCPSPT